MDFSVYDVKAPKISAHRCDHCGAKFYPAPMVCSRCGARRDPVTGLGWSTFALEGACTLLTWTRVWNLPEGYTKKFLQFGLVEFDGGLRASGRIDVETPCTGLRLTAAVEEADERPGRPVKVFVFR